MDSASVTNTSADGKAPAGALSRSAEASTSAAAALPSAWRILFVGGDRAWFDQVQRDMLALQPNWLCWHAADVPQGLKTLSAAAFQAVVMASQAADAARLFDWVEQLLPETIRVARCDMRDRLELSEWTRSGVVAVGEELDATGLASSLKRVSQMRGWLADPAIKNLVPALRKFPVVPRLHAQVTEQLSSATGSLETVAQLIAQDPVMAAKMLQIVNSAVVGLAREITDVSEAVMYLGTERIRSLILVTGVFSQFEDVKCPGFLLEPIWSHSLEVGAFARAIALAETKAPKTAEAAFTAGLLHDIGKLVLAANLPDKYSAVLQLRARQRKSEPEAELQILGTTHADLGAYVLGTWGMPLPLLEAVAWHHCPARSENTAFSLLTAVHAANVFARQKASGGDGGSSPDGLDLEYLARLGLSDRPDAWRELCGAASKSE
jgi:putative nucleotidyltransferase with HDIG domain